MSTDQRPKRQHWVEAVAECSTDEQAALRLVGFYRDGEWQQAMLNIGRENLMLKRDLTVAREQIAALTAERDGARERCAVVESALEGMLAIVSDSTGVAGYHMNGDVAEWGEFEEVGLAKGVMGRAPLAFAAGAEDHVGDANKMVSEDAPTNTEDDEEDDQP